MATVCQHRTTSGVLLKKVKGFQIISNGLAQLRRIYSALSVVKSDSKP